MDHKMVDFLIIGHGLAGAVLAHQLLAKNHTIHVVNQEKPNAASLVAAGIYNPVTYRRLIKAEFAEMFIPVAHTYYTQLEKTWGSSFFSPLPFYKLLTSVEELNNWHAQGGVDKNAPFMSPNIITTDFSSSIDNPYGAGHVLQAGVLNTREFLAASAQKLGQLGAFTASVFDHTAIQKVTTGFLYEGITAKYLVFAEGVGALRNPYFDWVPLQQFKGEVLIIDAPTLPVDVVINKGVFILPLGGGKFKVGATHDWRNVNEIPTEEGKRSLLEKLDTFIRVPYTVVDHAAGLRPASRDRRAFIGAHPTEKNMFIFNGLGSKGVIAAPWLARHFEENFKTQEWSPTFNINRYYKFYHHDKKN